MVIHTFIHGLTGRGYGVGRGRGAETLVWTAEKETMYQQQHHMNQHHNHHQLEFRGICLALPQSPAAGQRGGWYLHIYEHISYKVFFSSLVPPIKVQTS